jgi:glutathione peroxidase-family protein
MRQIKNILTFLISMVLLMSCETYNKKEIMKQEARDHSLFMLNLDSVKHQYGKKFTELRTIINRYDPIGLHTTGTPKGEYEPEVKTIIVQLKKEMTEEQVHDLIYQEFLRWFEGYSIVGKKESYKKLANAISRWDKTGFYINEKGEAHIDSIYIDESEVGKYKKYETKK